MTRMVTWDRAVGGVLARLVLGVWAGIDAGGAS